MAHMLAIRWGRVCIILDDSAANVPIRSKNVRCYIYGKWDGVHNLIIGQLLDLDLYLNDRHAPYLETARFHPGIQM